MRVWILKGIAFSGTFIYCVTLYTLHTCGNYNVINNIVKYVATLINDSRDEV